MRKLLGEIIFHVFSNTIALYAAASLVAGFTFSGDFIAMLTAAAILTAINLLVKPILKLFFGPLILLTFGLFSIVINALTLGILDFFSSPLTIQGYIPLLYGTLIVTAVNLAIALSGRWIYKE